MDKTFVVSGITTPLKKVVVSLHITHTADSDLDISLIGPDGTTVNLSSDNGGTSSMTTAPTAPMPAAPPSTAPRRL